MVSISDFSKKYFKINLKLHLSPTFFILLKIFKKANLKMLSATNKKQ